MAIDLKHTWSQIAAFANNNLSLDPLRYSSTSYPLPRTDGEKDNIDPERQGFVNRSVIGTFYTVPDKTYG